VDVRDVQEPVPGWGEVLVRMRASTICGSDIRAIYREHTGRGAEAYRDVIAGHEPSGDVVAVGPGCAIVRPGDRVALYHIDGCGVCDECITGYMIGCTSERRAAYGWQRDGGHADYLLATERTCVVLPDSLSYLDGACVACGFGTAYEALRRANVSGADDVLVTGLGPVGLAAGMLARALGAARVIGAESSPERRELATSLGVFDAVVPPDEARSAVALHTGRGCSVAVDCSGVAAGRALAIDGLRTWGRCVLVGEGGTLEIAPSPTLIHKQMTVIGSWVTSVPRMRELVRRLDAWDLHPERTVTDRFPLEQAADAYALADRGVAGKVALVMGP
jgi:threonine dehydrogenase-like Zn-dependent dehydrogenase